MPFVSFLPDDAGMREIIMSRPEQMGPFSQLARVLMRGPSAFTEGERELIAAFVSSTNDCPFCVGAHAAAARKFDIPESTLQALASDLETAPIDERLKPVLRYVEKLTKTPYQMTQADADAVRAAGWDELALSDAVIGHPGKAPNFGGLSSPARRFRKPPIIAKFIDALGPVVRRSGGRTAGAV